MTALALGGLALLTGAIAPDGSASERALGVGTFVLVGAAVGFVRA